MITIGDKIKKVFSWLFMMIALALIVFLFVFKSSLVEFTSRGLQNQLSPVTRAIFTDSVEHLFNYANTNDSYNYTLIEFAASGCVSCNKMKKVVDEIATENDRHINVLTFMMTEPRGLQWGKYYGVVMIPTQIILNREGMEVFRHTGFISKDELMRILEN